MDNQESEMGLQEDYGSCPAGQAEELVPANGTAIARLGSVSPAELYLARLSPGSRPTMRWAVELIARLLTEGTVSPRELPWHTLTYAHTAALRVALVDAGYQPATVNRVLCALRGVLKEAWRVGLMDHDAMARAGDVAPVAGTGERAGRALDMDELAALLGVCDDDPRSAGARDGAILAVAYGAALRRAEICGLDLEDLDLQAGEAKVLGKGSKHRIAHLNGPTVRRLERWIEVREVDHGPLFVGLTRYGTQRSTRLTPGSVRTILHRRVAEAGIAPTSPHDLRRSSISSHLDAGHDLAVVADIAGHRSPVTTAGYDRRGERARARAASDLPMPA